MVQTRKHAANGTVKNILVELGGESALRDVVATLEPRAELTSGGSEGGPFKKLLSGGEKPCKHTWARGGVRGG